MPRGASTGRPVRDPGPYDVMINGQGFMCFGGQQKPGQPAVPSIEYIHPDPLAAASPTEFSYSAQNPVIEATYVYDNLVAGFGQKFQQHKQEDHRYFFTSNMDLSIQGQWTLGPYITLVTPNSSLDTTHGISDFFEIGSALYALNGRYVLKRGADTAAGWGSGGAVKDLGSGKVATDVLVMRQNTTSTTYAYVCMGDTEPIWKYDGTTWTQSVEALYATRICLVGKEVYKSVGNTLQKLDQNADPFVLANWSTTYYIGDASSGITRLMVDSSGTLIIAKTDGLYILDRDGYDQQLTSDLKLNPDTNNGKLGAYKYENYTNWTLNGRHFRLSPGPYYQMDPIGPERFAENDSPVAGVITAGCGTRWAAYGALWNPDSGHSYLMKYGAYTRTDDGSPHRLDVWHGSLSSVSVTGASSGANSNTFSSRKIQALSVSTIGGAPAANHETLMIGCSDGTIGWFPLPCKPNPVACSNYAFQTTGSSFTYGQVFFPFWNGGFPKDEKVIRAGTTTGTVLDYLAVSELVLSFNYRKAGSTASYSSIHDAVGIGYVTPATRYPFDITVTQEDMALVLQGYQADGVHATPVVSAFALHYGVNPPIQRIADISILAENGVLKRDGSLMRIGATQIRSLIQTAIATTAGVAVIGPDGTSYTMQLGHYRETQRWDQQSKQWRSVIVVRAIQSDVNVTQGLASSLS